MSLGNVLGAAAPIAAGYFTGGAGFGIGASIGAGAVTGMGIAALSGNDVLMGGVTGGLGGFGGGNMYGAFNPTAAVDVANSAGTTTAVTNEAMLSPYTNAASSQAAGTAGSNIGMFSNPTAVSGAASAQPGLIGANGQLGANMGQVNTPSIAPTGTVAKPTTGLTSRTPGIPDAGSGGYTPTAYEQAYTTPGGAIPESEKGFNAAMNRLGDGSTSKGYMKAGLTSLPVLAAAFTEEEEDWDWDEERPDKYDPDATLNLNDQDTGINDALKEDSGLRLYAGGGVVNQPAMNVNNAGANVMGGGMNVNNAGANLGLNSSANLNEGASNIQGLGGLNVNSGAMGLTAEQQGLIDNPKYKLEGTGMYGQQRYVPTDYMGIGQFQDDLMGTTQKAGEAEAAKIASYQNQLEGSGTMNLNDSGANVMGGGMNVNNLPTAKFAMGGLTDGPGDGMSDDIPTTIDGEQPAALSQGEFVVPADVVSHLGNGSTEAGSKQLYAMMDEVRQARTGRKEQGTEINPDNFMPA